MLSFYDEKKSLRLLEFADELETCARLLLEAMRRKQAASNAGVIPDGTP